MRDRSCGDASAGDNKLKNSIIQKVSPYSRDREIFFRLGFLDVQEILRFLEGRYSFRLGTQHTVLDIGCGVGRLELFIAPFVKEIIALDISQEMLDEASLLLCNFKNVRLELTDGKGTLSQQANTIDLIFSYGVFGFVSNETLENYVKESYRVLKSGGILLFQIPNYRLPFGLFRGCNRTMALERLKLLATNRLSKPTEKSKLGTPREKGYLYSLLSKYGFQAISVVRPSPLKIYYLVSGLKLD